MAKAERQELVDTSLQTLFLTIIDFENYPRFVGGMKRCHIREKNADHWVVDFEMEMMKPVKYSIRVRMQEPTVQDNQKAKVWWDLLEGDLISVNNGCWELSSVGDTRTQVNYSLEVEFKISVPGFILKGMIGSQLPKSIREVADEAKRRT